MSKTGRSSLSAEESCDDARCLSGPQEEELTASADGLRVLRRAVVCLFLHSERTLVPRSVDKSDWPSHP